MIILSFASLSAEENKEDDSHALKITSATKYSSASQNLKLQEKGFTDTEESENDKKRTTVGVGESVNLTLEGKNIGAPEKIKWTVKNGKDKGSIYPESESLETTLVINKTLMNDNTIEIEVKNEFDDTAKIEFSICVPKDTSGRHALRSNNMGSKERGVSLPDYPADGNTIMGGASAKLQVVVQPISVNFNALHILESDLGTQPPSADIPHNPNPNYIPISDCNDFFDQIGYKDQKTEMLSGIAEGTLPESFIWDCKWSTMEGHVVCKNEKQIFKFNLTLDGLNITTSITKFSCTVTRDTLPNNKHSFSGGTSPK